ncbi:hypothetical protein QUH73_07140 [Labilibaculum sp. K2S]|uniref:hypothetical protein n=1 Tax=Labilibaculum sp. K2S TaxID=3056386 RepID=UPI0025A3F9EB|nr:hypothetical protein [Labilibaculum sp. K2S]MDM8159581.1 hypothetical protein [Labilibaculum sp. K2S]
MRKIYLLYIILFCNLSLLAQSPGGISSGLNLWLKADAGFIYNSFTHAEWLDQSPGNLAFDVSLMMLS